MKKHSYIFIFIIFFLILLIEFINKNTYRVIDITDDCKLVVDLNKNYKINDDEIFEIPEIIPYCSEDNIIKNKNIESENWTKNEYLHLITKTKEFYKRHFLNSIIVIDDNKNIYSNFLPLSKTLIDSGLAYYSDFKRNTKDNTEKTLKILLEGKNKEYYVFNKISRKYHLPDCPSIKSAKLTEVLPKEELPQNAKPCGSCILHKNVSYKKNLKTVKNSKFEEIYINYDNIDIYHFIGYGVMFPSSSCDNKMCRALLSEIKNAKKSIDIAVYELYEIPDLMNEIKSAKKRGVNVRFVTDNSTLTKIFNNLKPEEFADIVIDDGVSKESHRLMHNKFFIFDDKKVWTGSANLTPTSFSGFNANTSILINSEEIAKIYKSEFENFIRGKFHNAKETVYGNFENSQIKVYFSPKNYTITKEIIREIKNAKTYIHIPSFIITHKKFTDALIEAHKRGVEVKVITDANSSKNKYSTHNVLRYNGIPVKTENFAGMMHMKNIIIDGETVITGSMNFTKSGEQYNDENSLIIKDKAIAENFEKTFQTIWSKIPEKYLRRDPLAESFESTGSCFDGIDNNYNGLIDSQEPFCKQK